MCTFKANARFTCEVNMWFSLSLFLFLYSNIDLILQVGEKRAEMMNSPHLYRLPRAFPAICFSPSLLVGRALSFPGSIMQILLKKIYSAIMNNVALISIFLRY